jgi:hypothetical protein
MKIRYDTVIPVMLWNAFEEICNDIALITLKGKQVGIHEEPKKAH